MIKTALYFDLSYYKRIREIMTEPAPVAVWFIDRPMQYHQVMLVCSRRNTLFDSDGYISCFPSTLPIYSWGLQHMLNRIEKLKKDEINGEHFAQQIEAGKMFPFKESGIWAEMSDGNHQRIEIIPNSEN